LIIRGVDNAAQFPESGICAPQKGEIRVRKTEEREEKRLSRQFHVLVWIFTDFLDEIKCEVDLLIFETIAECET
jgi:hypothetical protein